MLFSSGEPAVDDVCLHWGSDLTGRRLPFIQFLSDNTNGIPDGDRPLTQANALAGTREHPRESDTTAMPKLRGRTDVVEYKRQLALHTRLA